MRRETNLFPHVYHPGDSLRGHGRETVLVARGAADLEDHAVALGLGAQVAAAAAALRGRKSNSNLFILFVGNCAILSHRSASDEIVVASASEASEAAVARAAVQVLWWEFIETKINQAIEFVTCVGESKSDDSAGDEGIERGRLYTGRVRKYGFDWQDQGLETT